jgi:benzoyl-CoA reductase subunit D
MTTAGIDCGSKNTKAVILNDGKLLGKGMVSTGFDLEKAVDAALKIALAEARISREDIRRIGGTGSGKDVIRIADISIDDIQAIGRAACHFFPNARTVADVGAEEGRAATIDAKGNPVNFTVNEKCAAGAGTFIEAMARALELTIAEMGSMCQYSSTKISLNTECAVFAESEVVGLIHSKVEKPDICRAIHDAMATRVGSMIRRIGIHENIVLMGGVANNPGFMEALKRDLKIENLYVPDSPEFGAAFGAALAAAQG